MKIQSFRDLIVWQKSLDLTESIYKLTKKLPKEEKFGLVSQMQRSAVSVPSNIAEGSQRNNKTEFRHFCAIAYGSAAELETQLILVERLYSIKSEEASSLLDETQRMLRQLIHKLGITNT